jgi:hypothetical protein
MNLDLNDVQAETLIRELHHIIQNDHNSLSPRIVTTEGDPGAATAGARAPGARCPHRGITSRRAGVDLVGGEGRLYSAGTDENTKIRNARIRTPTIKAIRVHNQAAFRPIVELHRLRWAVYRRHSRPKNNKY